MSRLKAFPRIQVSIDGRFWSHSTGKMTFNCSNLMLNVRIPPNRFCTSASRVARSSADSGLSRLEELFPLTTLKAMLFSADATNPTCSSGIFANLCSKTPYSKGMYRQNQMKSTAPRRSFSTLNTQKHLKLPGHPHNSVLWRVVLVAVGEN